MPMVFTSFLRSLDSSGQPGDSTDLPALWRALRRALRRELRRRGLWDSSPRLLGMDGDDSWQSGASFSKSSNWFPGDPLDELASEAYLRVFVSRVHSLKHHLESKPNVEGLVFRAIKHVVHDVQKQHDPLGFRVFELLRSSVQSLIDRGVLFFSTDETRIANATILTFNKEDDQGRTRPEEIPGSFIAELADDPLPELLVARGDERLRLLLALGERILELEERGISSFLFRDLVSPLKAEVRDRWGALLRTTEDWVVEGEDGDLVQWIEPDDGMEQADHFHKLTHCVQCRLQRMGGQKRTQTYRYRLWNFLKAYAFGADPARPRPKALQGFDKPGEALPSNRQLELLLGIPRHQFSGLFRDLETAIRECQQEIDARSSQESKRPLLSESSGDSGS